MLQCVCACCAPARCTCECFRSLFFLYIGLCNRLSWHLRGLLTAWPVASCYAGVERLLGMPSDSSLLGVIQLCLLSTSSAAAVRNWVCEHFFLYCSVQEVLLLDRLTHKLLWSSGCRAPTSGFKASGFSLAARAWSALLYRMCRWQAFGVVDCACNVPGSVASVRLTRRGR
jgi:hypothetical protein